MRIGLDGSVLVKPGSGIVRFSFEIINELIKNHKENEYVLYVYSKSNWKEKIKFKGKLTIKPINLHPLLWSTTIFTNKLDADDIGVFYSPQPFISYVPTKKRRVKLVCTSHGIIQGNLWPNFKEKLYWQSGLYYMTKNNDHILTVSEDCRQTIHNLYKRPLETISVCSFGLDKTMKPLSKQGKAKAMKYLTKKYNILNKEFIFQVAGPQPYKNVLTILKAWKLLKEEHKLNIPLIIARVNSNTVLDCELLKDRITMLGLDPKNIMTVPWIDFNDVPLFYGYAKLNLYPSLFEGVGFPLAESMACGTPSITSNISAMPECIGDAGLLVNKPLDENEWADKICEVYNNPKIQKYYIKLGLQRSKDFTWKKVANTVIASFKKV